MELADGWRILWRSPTDVQIGVDAPGALVLGDLDPRERDGLLGRGPVDGRVAGVLSPLAVRTGDVPVPESLVDEAAALTRAGWDAREVLDARARATVLIDGPTAPEPVTGAPTDVATGVALALAAAGVGTLLLGQDAAARAVRHTAPTARTHVLDAPVTDAHLTEVDLVVLVRSWVAPPAETGRLLALDVPHLLVTTGDVEAEIGPLVLPGRTACARCVALHRTDADPAYPALATQLATFAPRALDAVTRLRAAGTAAQAALAHLDGRPGGLAVAAGPTADVLATRAVRTGAQELLVDLVTYLPHPACGCRSLEAAQADEPPMIPPECSATIASTSAP